MAESVNCRPLGAAIGQWVHPGGEGFFSPPPDGFGANLLDPRATPLNQYDQNDDNQYTGNNPDQHCGVHRFLSLSFSYFSGFFSSRFLTRFEP